MRARAMYWSLPGSAVPRVPPTSPPPSRTCSAAMVGRGRDARGVCLGWLMCGEGGPPPSTTWNASLASELWCPFGGAQAHPTRISPCPLGNPVHGSTFSALTVWVYCEDAGLCGKDHKACWLKHLVSVAKSPAPVHAMARPCLPAEHPHTVPPSLAQAHPTAVEPSKKGPNVGWTSGFIPRPRQTRAAQVRRLAYHW